MALLPLQDLESAETAYNRVKAELEALTTEELAPINTDIVSATSIALGVADRILEHRDRMAKLPEFEIKHVDNLKDYAKAAWFAYVTNLPAPDPQELTQYIEEVTALRGKFLMWATPLVGSGKFDDVAIAKIREGSGFKDAASDLVALVGLYRSKWEEIKNMCGVTEEELTRASEIAPAVFGMVSRREFQNQNRLTDGALRVRRAWTLLDRAYNNCRRGLNFLRYQEGDADSLAPSLRRNAGNRSTPTEPPPPAPTTAPAEPHEPPPTNGSTPASVGGGDSPFMAKS